MIILLFIIPVLTYAHSKTPLMIGNEATAIPFTQFVTTPTHPGIQIGAEFEWRESRYLWLYPAMNIGYMLNIRYRERVLTAWKLRRVFKLLIDRQRNGWTKVFTNDPLSFTSIFSIEPRCAENTQKPCRNM